VLSNNRLRSTPVDSNGNSILHHAILAQKYDLARALVLHGADYNLLNQRGQKAIKTLPFAQRKLAAELKGLGFVLLFVLS